MHKKIKTIFCDLAETLGSKYYLEQIIKEVKSDEDLIRFIHRYTVFNGNFAGGVINLAGMYHVREDIFMDKTEDYNFCNGRGAEIASHLFYAAEDEYFDKLTSLRITHRRNGQVLLKSTLNYFEIKANDFNMKYIISKKILEVLNFVKKGYLIGQKNTEENLFLGLGFHLGSELLADEEFNIIDKFLYENHPKLLKFLVKDKSEIGFPAYRWIKQHTYVELEHFDMAITAVEYVLKYYNGKYSKEEILALIIEGFENFAKMQKLFFTNILK